jgi:hypothetical protein
VKILEGAYGRVVGIGIPALSAVVFLCWFGGIRSISRRFISSAATRQSLFNRSSTRAIE